MKNIIIVAKIFIFILFEANIASAYSQIKTIKGNIIEECTNNSIPNISIFLKENRIGTISDLNGNFILNIPVKHENEYLYFTGIGFKKDSMLLGEIHSPLTITLTPETYMLTEVYIMSDSTLLTLLRKAYSNIPNNYPNVPTSYEGFYRESAKNENEEQADFIEAILSIYKDSYHKPSDNPGQVELIKSRKRKIRDIGVMYYGGPSLAIKYDFILSRAEFIQPKKFKDFHYHFNGIKSLNSQEFYEISFYKTSKDTAELSGTMLIETESLAYCSFDINKKVKSLHPQIKYRNSNAIAHYKKINEKWYFISCVYNKEDERTNNDKKIYGTVEYITTSIKEDSVHPIPYEKQLNYFEPLILKADEYDKKKGWTDYDILDNVDINKTNFQFSIEESTEIYEKNYPKDRNFYQNKLIAFLVKFQYTYGFSYRNVTSNEMMQHIVFKPGDNIEPFNINSYYKKETDNFLFQSTVAYKLNRNINFFYQGSSDLFNETISITENKIGIEFSKNLKRTGYPLLIQTSIAYSSNDYFSYLGTFNNPAQFTYKGKKIDSKEITFDYGYKYKSIIPQISLAKSISQLFSVKFYVSYDIRTHSNQVFRLKEKEGGFFSKKTIEMNDDDKNLNIGNNDSPWAYLDVNRVQFGLLLNFN